MLRNEGREETKRKRTKKNNKEDMCGAESKQK
jgi:hypothetical protein